MPEMCTVEREGRRCDLIVHHGLHMWLNPMCTVEREGRRCDLIVHHGLHMWLNPTRPLVVAWGYTNSDETEPPGQGPASGWGPA